MRHKHVRYISPLAIWFSLVVLLLSGCGGSGGNVSLPVGSSTPKVAAKQILRLPNVGIADSASLDPALGPDQNTSIITSMIYSGLVRLDKGDNVIPDQATWDISSDNKVYTFHLKPGLTFSDGTPLTADNYVYSLTRALLPSLNSSVALFYEGAIVGASDVNSGKKSVLTGVKAVDPQTLQITLAQPTPYFLAALSSPVFYPVNKQLIDLYGQTDWVNHIAGNAAGSGPFMLKAWSHNLKMVLVPNPHYYGPKLRLTEVDMFFVNDPSIAYKAYRGGQYDFIWNLAQEDLTTARPLPGFTQSPQLETDVVFFNTNTPPFDSPVMRQAFAYATDKTSLAHMTLNDAAAPAPTIIPPGMPGYQGDYDGIPYDKDKAKALFQSIYPDPTAVPTITFSYSTALLSRGEAGALAHMWSDALGIPIMLRPVEQTAYADELSRHEISFGFIQWNADFPDPYDALALNLTTGAEGNVGKWSNTTFDQMVSLAEKGSGHSRLVLYDQAEQLAIQDVGWLPLDHQQVSAVIPPLVHGISVNANGLYFGDWSDVYLLQK